MDALFKPESGLFLPTQSALGPWSSDRLHGGATLGLLTHAAQTYVSDDQLRLCRLTADMFSPVPAQPLAVKITPLREGKRIRLLQVSVWDGPGPDAREVTRATALFLRPSDGSFHFLDDTPLPDHGDLPTRRLIKDRRMEKMRPGLHLVVETRWPERVPSEPKAIWFRLPLPVVAGTSADPTVAAIALSDFNNAVCSIMAYEDGRPTAHINTDTTFYLERPPVGDWFCLVADRQSDADAISIAQVTHYDERGRFGRSIQARLENRFVPANETKG